MRRTLDALYLISGGLAACCLFLIAAVIVAQILGRFVGITVDSTESGGFFLAGATFLGMAYTLKTGNQIRVTLLISKLKGRAAQAVEVLCCGFSAFGAGYLAWQTLGMVRDSWRFGDLSPGLLAVPFWFPQSVMLAGIVILAIAFVDELVLVLRGREPGYAQHHDTALDAGPTQ